VTDWLIRHWKVNAALVVAMCGVLLFAIPDSSSAAIGASIGAGVALLYLLIAIRFFPESFSRDPEVQKRYARQGLAWGALGVAAVPAIGALADSFESAVLGACGGFLLAMVLWRIWFERSDYAHRRWPKPEAASG
jgi:MFS family permease